MHDNSTPKRAHLEKHQVWAFNEQGEQVSVTQKTPVDDMEPLFSDIPEIRRSQGEAILKVLDRVFAMPDAKSVYREVYTLLFEHWPERIGNMTQAEVAKALGTSPQAYNQFLIRRMEKEGMTVRKNSPRVDESRLCTDGTLHMTINKLYVGAY